MKALQCVELAGPEKLIFTEVDDPKPDNGQVLVEIKAASVNFPDVLQGRLLKHALQSEDIS